MMELLIAALQLVAYTYFLSIGFGLVVAQGRGLARVNTFWLKLIRSVIRNTLQMIGNIFNRVGKKF